MQRLMEWCFKVKPLHFLTIMKKLIILNLFLFVAMSVSAQDDIHKKIAAETCDCVTKKNIDTSKRSEVEMALGLCMLQSIQANQVDIEVSDEMAMSRFGEKVGLQMAPICPDLFKVFMTEDAFEEEEEPQEVQTIQLTGKVKAIESGDLVYIVLKEDSGKEHKLLWLRYFSGSDDFKDDPKKLIGKKITISYQEIECYFPKLKGYYNAKEIVELTLNN
jgi:hypothetical protein